MKKLLFMLGFVLILLSSFVSAGIPSDWIYIDDNMKSLYTFDDGSTVVDTQGAANGSYQAGSTRVFDGNINSYVLNLDGSANGYVQLADTIEHQTNQTLMICHRTAVNASLSGTQFFINRLSLGTDEWFAGYMSAGNWRTRFYPTTDNSFSLSGLVTEHQWSSYCVAYFSGTMVKFFNGTNVANTTVTNPNEGGGNGINLGRRGGENDFPATGRMDDIFIYKTPNLNMTRMRVLAGEHANQSYSVPPTPPVNVTVNDSIESTAVVKQVGSITLLGPTPQTIFSSNFNITENNTDVYGAYSFNVLSTANNVLFCELEIDGVQVANVTRSNVAGVLGSVFPISDFFTLTSGEHLQELICNRESGPGQITISEAVGIGHFMIDEFNNTVLHDSFSVDQSVSSGNSYTQIGEINFTIGNLTGDDFIHALVIESGIEFVNNDASEETLYSYFSINDTTNCSIYSRNVGSGNTGSVSMDCILENVTAGSVYNVKMFGNGTNSEYVGNVLLKEFFLSPEEIVGGTGILNGTWFNGSSDVLLFNTTGGNLNHALANAFNKVSFSIQTDANTEVNLYIKLLNGDTFTSKNFTRNFEAGKTGVLIGQDSFENVAQDNYTLQLWANCGGTNCQIKGGAGVGYITDVTTTIQNTFNVTATNTWTGNSIQNFSVSNGATFSTTTGSLVFTTTNPLENLTISSPGYFNSTILNHNTTNDLAVELNRTQITLTAHEIFSDINILNFTINNSFFTKSTTTGTMIVPFDSGINYFNITSLQYFKKEFNRTFTALDNSTINVSLADTQLTILANESLTGTQITNFSVLLTDVLTGETINDSTSTGEIEINVTKNRQYTITLNSTNYASETKTVTPTTNTTVQFLLFSFNSVRVNILYFENNTAVTDRNVTIITIADNINFSQTNVTDEGFLLIDFLAPESYELRFSATDLNPISKFVTILNDSTQELFVYMTFNTTAEIQAIEVVDTSNQNIEGAIVWLQQEQFINNTFQWITIQEAETDSEGKTSVFVERDVTVFYRFSVIVGGEAKPILPNNNVFTTKTAFIPGITETVVLIVSLEDGGTPAIEDRLAISGNITVSGDTFTYQFIDGRNTISGGTLEIWAKYINSSLNYELVDSITVLGSFGEINYTVPDINNTVWRADGLVIFSDRTELLDSKTITKELTIFIEYAVGLMLTALVYIFVAFMTVITGPLWSAIAAISSLALMSLFVYNSFTLTIINSLIVLMIILFFSFKKKNV